MSLTEELKSLGVDVDEGLDRVMGDSSLYEMMLGMFISSIDENAISAEDFAAADLEDLIKRVHSLKGVTGNLAMTPLFTGYTNVLGLLRGKQAEEARTVFEQLLPRQAEILDCIRRHQ